MDRYYDPATDQFLTVDPDLAETGQAYAFTGDDPLNATDPLGLCWGFCWVSHAYHRAVKVVKKVVKKIVKVVKKSGHRILRDVATTASLVAAGSSTLAFIPGVGEVAETVSVVAGGVAVTADGANCDWRLRQGSPCVRRRAVVPGLGASKIGDLAKEAETADAAAGGRAAINAVSHAQIANSYRMYQGVGRLAAQGLSFGALSASLAGSQ